MLFSVILFFLVVVTLVGILELFARYMVYGQGRYLKEIDPAAFKLLETLDPVSQLEKPVYIPDSKFGWRHSPDNEGFYRGERYPRAEFRSKVKFNSSGYRSSSEFSQDPAIQRIAVLGDSFVEAIQVPEEDTFPKVIEKKLKSDGYPFSVYNFGLLGTGTVHQIQILKYDVLKYKPRIVILTFFGNDLIDNSPYYLKSPSFLTPNYERNGSNVVLGEFGQKTNIPTKGTLSKNDFIVPPRAVADNNLERERMRQTISKISGPILFLKFFNELFHDKILPRIDDEIQFDVYKKDYSPALQESLDVTVDLIAEMKRECAQIEAYFLVVMVPAREQVYKNYFADYFRQRKKILDPSNYDVKKPQNVLSQELKARKIDCLDLLTDFRRLGEKNRLYYKTDGHFNQLGHQMAGELITEYLLSGYLKNENCENFSEFLGQNSVDSH